MRVPHGGVATKNPLRIAVIPGDGIGVEVTAEAVKALRAVASLAGKQLALSGVVPLAEEAAQMVRLSYHANQGFHQRTSGLA